MHITEGGRRDNQRRGRDGGREQREEGGTTREEGGMEEGSERGQPEEGEGG